MATGFDPATGLFEQFAGFFGLEDVDLRAFTDSTAPLDVVLGGERTRQAQVVKQADVLMLLALLPEHFEPRVLDANFQYYEPRCAHGSSLTRRFTRSSPRGAATWSWRRVTSGRAQASIWTMRAETPPVASTSERWGDCGRPRSLASAASGWTTRVCIWTHTCRRAGSALYSASAGAGDRCVSKRGASLRHYRPGSNAVVPSRSTYAVIVVGCVAGVYG